MQDVTAATQANGSKGQVQVSILEHKQYLSGNLNCLNNNKQYLSGNLNCLNNNKQYLLGNLNCLNNNKLLKTSLFYVLYNNNP